MSDEAITAGERYGDRRSPDIRLEEVALRSARAAVRDLLVTLGINPDDGDSFRAFAADLAYLRRGREQSEKFFTGAKVSILGALLVAMTSGLGWLLTFLFTPKH